MSRLESLIEDARADQPSSFDPQTSLVRALVKKEQRARRDRLVRRAIVGASGVTLLALLFVRAAVASDEMRSSSSSSSSATAAPEAPAAPRELAARAMDDGGFARD